MSGKLSRSILEQPRLVLDTSALFAEMDQFSGTFDSWWEEQMSQHSERKSEFLSAEQRNGMAIAELIRTREEFEAQEKELSRRIAEQETLLAQLAGNLEKIKLEESIVLPQIDALSLDKEAREEALAQEKARFNNRMEQQKLRKIELARGIGFYRERLGLELRRADDAIILVFTQIDQANPAREFSIGLRILKDNSYAITSCVPHLHELKPHFLELNKSGNLQRFVCTVRRKFQTEAC